MPKLTPKQERFVSAYRNCANVEESVRVSGCELSLNVPTGYYVYFLIDPRDSSIFYVGKGIRGRLHQHVKETQSGNFINTAKSDVIRSILASGGCVEEVVFAVARSEDEAFAIERQLIETFADLGLTNMVHGVVTANQKALRRAQYNLSRVMPKGKWLASLSVSRRAQYEREFGKPAEKIWDWLYQKHVDQVRFNSHE